MIPKKIHYIWLGGEKDELSKRCIDSWYRVYKDFEIVEWNEKNLDIDNQPEFVKKLYEKKKYQFVSDFLRLKLLYENGGIYLDTDVLAIKNFDETFLNNKFFIGVEKKNQIALGIIGSEKDLTTTKELQEFTINDYNERGLKPSPTAMRKEMRRRGFKSADKDIVIVGDMAIYPQEYFYPIPYSEEIPYCLTSNSVCAHLWNASWVNKESEWYKEKERVVNKYIKQLEDYS